MTGVVPVVQADRARCVLCRQPFDKHLPDMDRPDDWRLRVCPRAPTKAERYSPDTEHREMVAETARLEAEIERLRGEVAERDAALARIRNALDGCEGRTRDELDAAISKSVREAGLSLRKAAAHHGVTVGVVRGALARTALATDTGEG